MEEVPMLFYLLDSIHAGRSSVQLTGINLESLGITMIGKERKRDRDRGRVRE